MPAHIASKVEFQPQCVKNPPIAGRDRMSGIKKYSESVATLSRTSEAANFSGHERQKQLTP
ncbi:hypothetical protein CR513_51743, partial [Mucuna pruriens]